MEALHYTPTNTAHQLTEQQREFAWTFLSVLDGIDGVRDLRTALESAVTEARRIHPDAVEDTDTTCAYCRHSVEDCAHYLGCDECACAISVLPGD